MPNQTPDNKNYSPPERYFSLFTPPKKRPLGWKIGLGVGAAVLLVVVVLFNRQIGQILDWIGIKAQKPGGPEIILSLDPMQQGGGPSGTVQYTVDIQINQGTYFNPLDPLDPKNGSPLPFLGKINFNVDDLASQYPNFIESAIITVPIEDPDVPGNRPDTPMITVLDKLDAFGLYLYNRRLTPPDLGFITTPPILTIVLKNYPLEDGGFPINFQVGATLTYEPELGMMGTGPPPGQDITVSDPIPANGILNLEGGIPDFSLEIIAPLHTDPDLPTHTVTSGDPAVQYDIQLKSLNGFMGVVDLTAPILTGSIPNILESAVFQDEHPNLLRDEIKIIPLFVKSQGGLTDVYKITFSVIGTSGLLVHQDAGVLNINPVPIPQPDFSISITDPPDHPEHKRMTTPGGTVTYTITLQRINGYDKDVRLETNIQTQIPDVASYVFDPPIFLGGTPTVLTSALTVTMKDPAAAVTNTFIVTGTGNMGLVDKVVSDTGTLGVWDYEIVATPPARQIAPGESTTYTVNINWLNNFNEAVTLTSDLYANHPTFIAGPPNDPSFAVNPVLPGNSATFNFSVLTIGSSPATLTFKIFGESATSHLIHCQNQTFLQQNPPDLILILSLTPDFSIAVTDPPNLIPPNPAEPHKAMAVPTGTATYTITLTRYNNYAEDVTLSSNLEEPGYFPNSIASYVFNPPVFLGITPSVLTATLTVTIKDGVVTETKKFDIIGTGLVGGITQTRSDAATLGIWDYSVQISPPERLGIPPGALTTYDITIRWDNGFNEPINLTTDLAIDNPQYIQSAIFIPPTIPGGSPDVSVLQVQTKGSSPADITFRVTGTAAVSGLIRVTTARLTLSVTPDFDIYISDPVDKTRMTVPSGTVTYTITLQRINNYTGDVSLTSDIQTAIPDVASYLFNPAVFPGSNPSILTSILTIIMKSPAAAETKTFQVTGTGLVGFTPKVDPDIATLGVQDFDLAIAPIEREIYPTESTSYTIQVTKKNGFDEPITLSTNLLALKPSLAKVEFVPAVIPTGSNTAELRVDTSISTTTGTTDFQVTGSGSPSDLQRINSARLIVSATPDFSIEVTPEVQEVAPAGSTTYTVNVHRFNNFNKTVNLSNNLLTDFGDYIAAATFGRDNLPFGVDQTTLYVTAKDIANSHDVLFTVTGKESVSGIPERSDQATLKIKVPTTGGGGGGGGTITPPAPTPSNPDFTIAVDPITATTIYPGQSATYKVDVIRTGGFTGPVSLTTDVLQLNPDIATATFGKTIVPSGEDSTTLTLVARANAVIDSRTIFRVQGTNITLGDRKDEDKIAIIIPPQLPSTGPAPSLWFWIWITLLTIISWQQLHQPYRVRNTK